MHIFRSPFWTDTADGSSPAVIAWSRCDSAWSSRSVLHSLCLRAWSSRRTGRRGRSSGSGSGSCGCDPVWARLDRNSVGAR